MVHSIVEPVGTGVSDVSFVLIVIVIFLFLLFFFFRLAGNVLLLLLLFLFVIIRIQALQHDEPAPPLRHELLKHLLEILGNLLECPVDGLVFALVEHLDELFDRFGRCVELGPPRAPPVVALAQREPALPAPLPGGAGPRDRLHGIRIVTGWIDGPAPAEEPGRLALWRGRLDRLRRPVDG